ncbi:hypothetical protein TNCV_1491231 [Trichonephila clavipes]|nr:hypothetical protein TNCV_1491231 [Trichonephila clavipes]
MKTAGWSTRRVAGQVDRSECAVRNCWEQWTREEAILKSKRPFRALPLTPDIGNCVYSGAKPDQCGILQIGKRLC